MVAFVLVEDLLVFHHNNPQRPYVCRIYSHKIYPNLLRGDLAGWKPAPQVPKSASEEAVRDTVASIKSGTRCESQSLSGGLWKGKV